MLLSDAGGNTQHKTLETFRFTHRKAGAVKLVPDRELHDGVRQEGRSLCARSAEVGWEGGGETIRKTQLKRRDKPDICSGGFLS